VSSVILGALAGWFTGRTLRTGDLAVVDVVLGVAGASSSYLGMLVAQSM